jgi:hypothetical protein
MDNAKSMILFVMMSLASRIGAKAPSGSDGEVLAEVVEK